MNQGKPATKMLLKAFAATSMQGVMSELQPQFERSNACRLTVQYDPATLTLERLRKGEVADVMIHSTSAMNQAADLGKLVAGSRLKLASNGIGVAVLAGAAKPDIGTVDAFKRTLLQARSIACTEVGASGIYFAGLIERLGIAREVRAKSRMRPGGLIGELVASGEAEIAIQQIPELMAVPGIELVGPLPAELQVISTMEAALFAGTAQTETARQLIRFLATPAAVRALLAKGYQQAV
jgi:molybdate transport system substrate-binding protein